MRDPYRQLAQRYDLMTSDPGIRAIYREFRRALKTAAAAHRMRPRVIVDLACTGTAGAGILASVAVELFLAAAFLRILIVDRRRPTGA